MPLSPELEEVLAMMNSVEMPPLDSITPAEYRELFTFPPAENPQPVGRIEDRRIPGGAGEIDARIYSPEGDGPFPVVAFFHGGGFVLCDLETHDEQCRVLCDALNAVVVSVDYRLAPEAKYPAAPEDCYAATRWCADNMRALKGDPGRLIVAGDSAGGCLAAVVSQMAREQGGPAIAHQLLIYPVTHFDFSTESYRDFAEGYFLTRDMMRWFWDHYLEQDSQGAEPYASPLLASDLSGLPPATVVTAGFDPLRDEGKAYADRLEAAGVPVSYRCFDDMIHGFLGLPVPVTAARDAVQYMAERVRTAIG